jgi:hypothetical protein
MVQCRLRELMAIRGRQTRRKVTYDLIREVTGLSKNTLARLANDRADLFIYVPASEAEAEQ